MVKLHPCDNCRRPTDNLMEHVDAEDDFTWVFFSLVACSPKCLETSWEAMMALTLRHIDGRWWSLEHVMN
jgi:hypothetical protein